MALAQHEGKRSDEEIADVVRRAKPMSILSKEEFHIENARQVKGKLILFNKELFGKHFPGGQDFIEKLSVFSDRSTTVKMDLEGADVRFELLRLPQHERNLSLNVKFSDSFGEVYNYIDIKGVGLPKKSQYGSETIEKAESGMWGLVAYESAMEDWRWSKLLIKNGAKTSAPLAVIKIDSVILANCEEVSIEDLKKQGRMPRTIQYEGDKGIYEYTPVIYLRAFPEVMRLDDAKKEDLEKFAKEHGMSLDGYTDWWIGREAKNLATIHRLGKLHSGLHPGNLTIDGRIVDNDDFKDYPTGAARKGAVDPLAREIGVLIGDVFLLNMLAGISNLEKPERAALLVEKYLEGFKDITKEEFRGVYKYFTSNYIYTLQGTERIRELFKRKFNEELEQYR